MAAVLAGKFHARDANKRVYLVHEFHDSESEGADSTQPVVSYKLAIGDRVKHLQGDVFKLVHNDTELTREPVYVPPAV